ncbi:sulfur carrier protein ThiS [Vibrio nitrifigilis]|uniref:Sulfur carrier protein ThiS n=1 Tax=Vibrio nitrifigilis TaxID=2789781 RepID=A0ABS0GHX3_9VIBR|nr:sulfur carrier protein ThiS [Vibrio nitrifigilis]MBF9002031.1 sulfur carrier protein ThiS [Vibrio nitrifigilis]
MIEIVMNGNRYTIDINSTVLDLVQKLEIESLSIALAINYQVVPSSLWSSVTLEQGDSVTTFSAVVGG